MRRTDTEQTAQVRSTLALSFNVARNATRAENAENTWRTDLFRFTSPGWVPSQYNNVDAKLYDPALCFTGMRCCPRSLTLGGGGGGDQDLHLTTKLFRKDW
jgi:hypothetical protein